MPIIRVTRKQIEEANKAREAAFQNDADFRLHEEQQRRLELEAAAAAARKEEQPS